MEILVLKGETQTQQFMDIMGGVQCNSAAPQKTRNLTSGDSAPQHVAPNFHTYE